MIKWYWHARDLLWPWCLSKKEKQVKEGGGNNPLKGGEEHPDIGIGLFLGRVACDRVSLSPRTGMHLCPCARIRLEQLMENTGLSRGCGGFGVWQTEPGFWALSIYGHKNPKPHTLELLGVSAL